MFMVSLKDVCDRKLMVFACAWRLLQENVPKTAENSTNFSP